MCIFQQVKYLTVEYKLVIECDLCIGKISVFMNFNIENDRSTDADVGWYVNNFVYNAEKISGLLMSAIVLA